MPDPQQPFVPQQQPVPPAGPYAQQTQPMPPAGSNIYPTQPPYGYQPQPQPGPNPQDTGSMGWAVLGFFLPIVGLILWLVWKDDKPLTAKKAGVGALASVIACVVIYMLVFVVALIFASAGLSTLD